MKKLMLSLSLAVMLSAAASTVNMKQIIAWCCPEEGPPVCPPACSRQ